MLGEAGGKQLRKVGSTSPSHLCSGGPTHPMDRKSKELFAHPDPRLTIPPSTKQIYWHAFPVPGTVEALKASLTRPMMSSPP